MTDRTITFRVDRNPPKQPEWARKFLKNLGLNLIGKVPTDATIVQNVNVIVGRSLPFNPPVTLTYTNDHFFEFTWVSEAERTMFLLKWS